MAHHKKKKAKHSCAGKKKRWWKCYKVADWDRGGLHKPSDMRRREAADLSLGEYIDDTADYLFDEV